MPQDRAATIATWRRLSRQHRMASRISGMACQFGSAVKLVVRSSSAEAMTVGTMANPVAIQLLQPRKCPRQSSSTNARTAGVRTSRRSMALKPTISGAARSSVSKYRSNTNVTMQTMIRLCGRACARHSSV